MQTITILRPRRELARRSSSGFDVALLWDAAGNTTSIEIRHAATEETLSFTVPNELALDAFYHPFAHLIQRAA